MRDPWVLPQMKKSVAHTEFHDTHDTAEAARDYLEGKDAKSLSTRKIRQLLGDFEAAQELTDAEDGPDFMFAASYKKEIDLLRKELKRRERNP